MRRALRLPLFSLVGGPLAAALLFDLASTLFVAAPRPALALGAVALGATLALWRPLRPVAAATLALTAALSLTAHTPLLRPALRAMTERGAPRVADAIVVLGGGVDCASGRFEAHAQGRFDRGVGLWREGRAPVLVFSRASARLLGPSCPSDADAAARDLRRAFPGGGPTVLTLDGVENTDDEARETARLARRHGWKRVLLVTSYWHSRRAARMFRRHGVDVTSVPAESPAPAGGFVPEAGWRRVFLRETGAYVKALVRGQF